MPAQRTGGRRVVIHRLNAADSDHTLCHRPTSDVAYALQERYITCRACRRLMNVVDGVARKRRREAARAPQVETWRALDRRWAQREDQIAASSAMNADVKTILRAEIQAMRRELAAALRAGARGTPEPIPQQE